MVEIGSANTCEILQTLMTKSEQAKISLKLAFCKEMANKTCEIGAIFTMHPPNKNFTVLRVIDLKRKQQKTVVLQFIVKCVASCFPLAFLTSSIGCYKTNKNKIKFNSGKLHK